MSPTGQVTEPGSFPNWSFWPGGELNGRSCKHFAKGMRGTIMKRQSGVVLPRDANAQLQSLGSPTGHPTRRSRATCLCPHDAPELKLLGRLVKCLPLPPQSLNQPNLPLTDLRGRVTHPAALGDFWARLPPGLGTGPTESRLRGCYSPGPHGFPPRVSAAAPHTPIPKPAAGGAALLG